jgi:transcriptional regulator with XRE-family HTH domain
MEESKYPIMFGEFFKKLRKKNGYTLREYCRTFKKDPGNISKMERGLMNPPKNDEELKDMAYSLRIKENSSEWEQFFILASVSAGRIPTKIMSDEDVLNQLPIFLRTVTGKKLSKEKLEALIELIKSQ